MRRKIFVILLIAVLFSVQDATLSKASSVYDESLELWVGLDNMTCSSVLWLTVSSPDGPFSISDFTSEPSFVSLNIETQESNGITPVHVGDLVVNYNTRVQINLNMTTLSDSVQRKVVADALRRKLENFFQIFLVYNKDLSQVSYGVAEYDYISDVPIMDKLRFEFLRQEFPGLSQLLPSNLTAGDAGVLLGLGKIDGSFQWSFLVIGFGKQLFRMNFGQEYTLSLSEILSNTGTISSAPEAHSSSIYVKFFLGNNTFTFVPLGTEPEMSMTQDDPLRFTFYADVTGDSFYDVRLRFKILEPGADPTMYATAVLGVFSCVIGFYLYRKRKLKSSHYGL